MKIAILGCGLRTPLLLSGLARSPHLSPDVVLFDLDPQQASLMGELGRAAEPEAKMRIRVANTAIDAIEGCDFVISSIRPGGMKARARDERICQELGYAGQETVGPAGCAMAWRTIPAVLGYASLMEKYAPKAWLVNFANPAGVVTQAIHSTSPIRAVGICDTPAELFLRIAFGFGIDLRDISCDYFGLNHLGFIRTVSVKGSDRTQELLQDSDRLQNLYPAPLFPADLIREIGLIPTEYVYFYYRRGLARANQNRVGRTRGEELVEANELFYRAVHRSMQSEGVDAALRLYVHYLNHRNASYMQLEGAAMSASWIAQPDWDPFAAATGYHRIAVQTIEALSGAAPSDIVLNVPNRGALRSMDGEDVVEIVCRVDHDSIHRPAPADIPRSVAGLVESAKAYERSLVEATIAADRKKLVWALTQNPLIGDWDEAARLAASLISEER